MKSVYDWHNCEGWHTGGSSPFDFGRLPFYLTFASVAAVMCSISASNCLIAAAVLALLACHFRFGDALRFPPVKLPLGLFFWATLISVALSGHIREGWRGPRKFYLCFVLLLIASTFRKLGEVRALVVACTGMMTLSAAWSLEQFWRKTQEAQAQHQDFRTYYTVKRITGFTSHWMTLSGEEMMVLMLLCALLFFAASGRSMRWLSAAGVVIAAAFVAAYTRSEGGLPTRRRLPTCPTWDYIDARGTNRHAAGSPTVSCYRTHRRAALCAALGVGSQ